MLKEIAFDLYKTGVFKVGKFKLKSGDTSPFYLDLRLIPSTPSLFKKVVNVYTHIVKKFSPQAVAGIMSAGIPFATGVCLELGLPLLQIRSTVKKHGTKKMVEGIIPEKGEQVVLLDDLISTGASKLEPYNELRNFGLEVKHLVVLVDRTPNQEVKQMLADEGLQLHSAGTVDDLFEGLRDSEINTEDLKIINEAFDNWKLRSESN